MELLKLSDKFQKTLSFRKIYMYVYIFILIYIEFGYKMVVANRVSGNIRMLILIVFTAPIFFFGMHKTVSKTNVFLFLYLSLYIVLNIARDSSYGNYLQLFIPILIGFAIATFIDMKIVISVFSDIMVFLAAYSLVIFAISLLLPGVILHFPVLGLRFSTATVHDALFSVVLTDTTTFRNYGIAWEPGAFALLLCVALFYEMNLSEKKSIKRILVIVSAIVTTFSTMGYFVLAAIIISSISNKTSNRSIGTALGILAMLILVMGLLPAEARELVFSKLDGLFSDGGDVNYTMQARLDAIKYPFEAFASSPLFGVGYDRFSYINKTFCNGVATNTVINWFAVMGLFFGVPCTVGYLKTVLRVSNDAGFHLLAKILMIVASLLLISTESLLRISIVYTIVFYGFTDNHFTEETKANAVSLHSGGIQTESVG